MSEASLLSSTGLELHSLHLPTFLGSHASLWVSRPSWRYECQRKSRNQTLEVYVYAYLIESHNLRYHQSSGSSFEKYFNGDYVVVHLRRLYAAESRFSFHLKVLWATLRFQVLHSQFESLQKFLTLLVVLSLPRWSWRIRLPFPLDPIPS